jgi:hypothetical protein
MRKTSELAVLLLMLAPAAFAQIPKGDVFVGYSYSWSTLTAPVFPPDVGGIVGSGKANLNGWNVAVGGKLFPFVKLVGDFSGHSGSETVTDQCGFILGCTPVSDELHARTYHLLFGPRVHVSVGRLTPFAHALFGVGHTSEHTSTGRFSDSSSNFADAFGGGIDCRLLGPLGWRVQADFLQDRFFSTTEHNFRFSTGVVLGF